MEGVVEDPKLVENKEDSDVKVKDVLTRIHTHIDRAQEDIDNEFVNEESKSVIKGKSSYFICKNKFWDVWFQKLFAQVISVKIWIIALITILLATSLISSAQFATILGIIMGLKGTFQVASVWKNNGNGNNSEMDKT